MLKTFLTAKVFLAPGKTITRDETQTVKGIILDLSETGCLLSFCKDLNRGNKIGLDFELPNGGIIRKANGIIRRVEKSADTFTYGIEFMNLEVASRDLIAGFVSLCQDHFAV